MSRTSCAVLLLLAVSTLESIAGEPPGLADAIRVHRALALEQPGDLELLNDLGNLLVLAGEMTEAEQIYRRALDLDRDFAEAHYNLALLLHQTDRRRLAKQELHRVLKLRPDDPWSLYHLGILYAEGGDRARAIRYYSKAFSIELRLSLPAVNPHILENKLATPALLSALSSRPAAELAPRLYVEPGHISELLLPPLPEAQEIAPRAEESGIRDSGGVSRGWAGAAQEEADQEVGWADALAPASAASETEREDIAAEQEAQRRPSTGEILPAPPRGASGDRPPPRAERPGFSFPFGGQPQAPANEGESREPPASGGTGDSPEAAEQAPTVPGSRSRVLREQDLPPARGSQPGHRPGLFSTGRLDLRLIPTARDQWASLPPGS